MSVGNPVDKGQTDNVSGALARQIQMWTPQVNQFKAFLDAMPDADLEAPPFGYTADEVALLKSAVNDMAILAGVYLGTADHTPASPLNIFVNRIAGLPPVR